MMKNKIGIMNGRLSSPINNNIQAFPTNTWKKEFEVAQKIGFEVIEWVFDSQNNPIMNDAEITEIKKLMKKYGVLVNSVCADFFMQNKLFGESISEIEKNFKILNQLLLQSYKLGIDIVVLPFVDSSSLKNEKQKNEIILNLEPVFEVAKKNNITISLETDLEPLSFCEFLSHFNHPNVTINYDTGNSAANGFDPQTELKLLNSKISSIHIKDRIRNGKTVPLGSGDTDFNSFFSTLKKIGYSGNFIIQGAREDLTKSSITPEETCKKYLKFLKHYLDKYLDFRD